MIRKTKPLNWLASDARNEFEIFVDVKHRQPCELGGRSNEQVGNRRGTMLTVVSEEQLHFPGAILNCRRREFDRKKNQRRAAERGSCPGSRARGIADFETSDRGNAHKTTVDSLGPQRGICALAEANER